MNPSSPQRRLLRESGIDPAELEQYFTPQSEPTLEPELANRRPEPNHPCDYCGATSKVSAVPDKNGLTYACVQCFSNLRFGRKHLRVDPDRLGTPPKMWHRNRRKFDPDHFDIKYRG